jgi:hypothetical protein
MITVKLAEDQQSVDVLTFDGIVLEAFTSIFEEGSRRAHISHIESIQLETDRKGKHKLTTKRAFGFCFPPREVDDSWVARANQLVEEVQRAKASFRFD